MSEPPERLHADIAGYAYAIREHALRMVARADASHIGGALSMADLLAVLYHHVLRVQPADPTWPERDRFILSKGHCCSGLYAALALKGFFSVKELDTYGDSESRLMNHVSHAVPGVEWSTGSLGHGLGLACGQALAAKRKKQTWRTFCVLSDGELDEGSTWEAVLFAGHHRLSNLWAIVDANKIQSLGDTREVLDLGSIRAKFEAFGWEAVDADGHNLPGLLAAFERAWSDRPRCIVAHTVKGRGVAFMENKLEWHYRAPKTPELLERALAELAAAYPS
ncbi:MAG TPA: transketolase [Kiritimatiellia bacterium]|nr:transketolase [Kiritimatiellia bacterium]